MLMICSPLQPIGHFDYVRDTLLCLEFYEHERQKRDASEEDSVETREKDSRHRHEKDRIGWCILLLLKKNQLP